MLGAMLVLLASCTKDLKNQINELDKRLTDVENLVASMNTQLTKLQELIDGKLFITGVEDKEDGSHVVSFVNSRGELSTITIYDGQDGMTPDISVKQAPDGTGSRLPLVRDAFSKARRAQKASSDQDSAHFVRSGPFHHFLRPPCLLRTLLPFPGSR